MKSVKKRFKLQLEKLHASATDLLWLSQDISVLQDAEPILQSLLQACSTLRSRATEIDKVVFTSEMMEEEAVEVLTSLMDLDLVSLVEQRCFQTIPKQDPVVATLLQQLLNKVESRYGAMLEDIRVLMMLLEEEA